VLAQPEDDSRRLSVTYADGDGAAGTRGLLLPLGHSLSGHVLASGEPLMISDFRR